MMRHIVSLSCCLTLLPFLVFGIVLGVGWTAAIVVNAVAPSRSQ